MKTLLILALVHLFRVSCGGGGPDLRFDVSLPFEKINDGVFDEWNKANPLNVKGFSVHYGNNTLYLVSIRDVNVTGSVWPIRTSARGGIVSTFSIPTKTWTHKPYDAIDNGATHDQIFTLNGRLFQWTYNNDNGKIEFRKLLFWSDESAKWQEVPIEVDPESLPKATRKFTSVTVSVPRPDSDLAYVALSNYDAVRTGSELSFSKLQIQFQGNNPTKASLKFITRVQDTHSFEVAFTAEVEKNQLLVLVNEFLSDGLFSKKDFAYIIDLASNQASNVTLTGTVPPQDFISPRIHQTQRYAFVLGGLVNAGLGTVPPVHKIWALDLKERQWLNTNNVLDESADEAVTIGSGTIYEVSLKKGVFSSHVPN